LPDLLKENELPYQVYRRVYSVNEGIDPFKVMELLGVDDQLRCLDLIQSARIDVLELIRTKGAI
jgi:hypothetical protein